MSTFRSVSWAIDSSQARGNSLLVLLALANRFDPDEPEKCWPSTRLIAAEARVSERTVFRCLDELVALGEVEVVHRGGGSPGCPERHRPNRYVLPKVPAKAICQVDGSGESDMPTEPIRYDSGGDSDMTLVAEDSLNESLNDSSSPPPASTAVGDEFEIKRRAKAEFDRCVSDGVEIEKPHAFKTFLVGKHRSLLEAERQAVSDEERRRVRSAAKWGREHLPLYPAYDRERVARWEWRDRPHLADIALTACASVAEFEEAVASSGGSV